MSKPLAIVVDDDELLGEAYVQALQICGFTARHIIDSTQALTSISQGQPIVVVLDMQMPKLNGAQVLKSIRDHESTAGVKVIVATANHILLDDSIREMADLVLQKPVSMYQIMEFARRMLRLHETSELSGVGDDQA